MLTFRINFIIRCDPFKDSMGHGVNDVIMADFSQN